MEEKTQSRQFRITSNLRRQVRLGFWAGCAIAALILMMWAGNLFTSWRLRLNNIYFLPSETTDTIVIVTLDDESLATYGRAPVEWSREVYADLVQKLNEGGARVIAFDILFAEETPEDSLLADAIVGARGGAFHPNGERTRTILPLVGVDRQEIPNSDTQQIRFDNTLATNPTIAAAAEDLAYVNTLRDIDSTVRRQPSLIEANGELELSFSLATLMAFSGIPPLAYEQLLISEEGLLRITPDLTPKRVLHVDERGFWQQNYFGTSEDAFTSYAIQDVLNGEVDPSVFEGKIVLVGLVDATGATDRYDVPLGLNGRSIAGVEIHANAIETLLQEVPLRQASPTSQAAIIIILTIAASITFALMRWYWSIAGGIVFLAMSVVAAFVIFDTQQIVIDILYLILPIGLPVLANLGIEISQEVNRRRRVEFLLESVVKVSNQQLNLDSIVPLIAGDIQQAVNSKRGGLWLWDDERSNLRLVYQYPDTLQQPPLFPINRIDTLTTSVTQGHEVVVPFRWQGTLLGGAAIELPHPATEVELNLLNTLAEQVAPGFANARLFTKTEQQKDRLLAIQNGSPNGIIILDESLTVLTCNPEVDEQLGLSAADCLGKPLQDMLGATDLEEDAVAEVLGAFAKQKDFQDILRLGEQSYNLHAIRLKIDQAWLVMLYDVTTLAQLSELKTRMIRMASHDLKNPLARVLGYADFLEESITEEHEHRPFLDRVISAAHEMNRIIEDILNLEQLRSGKTQLELLNLASVVREVLVRHTGDMKSNGQTFVNEVQTDLPHINGDLRQLPQAFTNLIGNAVKYTPEGGTITVRLFAKDDQTVRFEVQDTGYGMPKEAQDKLFTQFYRVRTKATAHIKGTGLGLSLVKSIIEEHGGKIWVESEEDVGSTFYVELPFAAEALLQQEASH